MNVSKSLSVPPFVFLQQWLALPHLLLWTQSVPTRGTVVLLQLTGGFLSKAVQVRLLWWVQKGRGSRCAAMQPRSVMSWPCVQNKCYFWLSWAPFTDSQGLRAGVTQTAWALQDFSTLPTKREGGMTSTWTGVLWLLLQVLWILSITQQLGSRRSFSSQECWEGFYLMWMSELNWLLRKVKFYVVGRKRLKAEE